MESTFPDTPWSLIAEAATSGGDRAALLRQLLERYWQPVHRAIRFGWRIPEPRARELVSAFLRRMLGPALLAALDPEQTRFRDLLKAKLLEFMTDATHELEARECAPPFELAEVGDVPPSSGDPAAVFDEQWALLVIHRALERLRQTTARSSRTSVPCSRRGTCAASGQPTRSWRESSRSIRKRSSRRSNARAGCFAASPRRKCSSTPASKSARGKSSSGCCTDRDDPSRASRARRPAVS